jgi:hypothetical protein
VVPARRPDAPSLTPKPAFSSHARAPGRRPFPAPDSRRNDPESWSRYFVNPAHHDHVNTADFGKCSLDLQSRYIVNNYDESVESGGWHHPVMMGRLKPNRELGEGVRRVARRGCRKARRWRPNATRFRVVSGPRGAVLGRSSPGMFGPPGDPGGAPPRAPSEAPSGLGDALARDVSDGPGRHPVSDPNGSAAPDDGTPERGLSAPPGRDGRGRPGTPRVEAPNRGRKRPPRGGHFRVAGPPRWRAREGSTGPRSSTRIRARRHQAAPTSRAGAAGSRRLD